MTFKKNGHDLACTCPDCIKEMRREERDSLLWFCFTLAVVAFIVVPMIALIWRALVE